MVSGLRRPIATRLIVTNRGVRLLAQAVFGIQLPQELESDTELAGTLEELVHGLGDYQAGVLILRFGLPWPVPRRERGSQGGYHPGLYHVSEDDLETRRTRTLTQVGRHFGVTRERARQVELKGLRRLRHPSRSKRLRAIIERLQGDPLVREQELLEERAKLIQEAIRANPDFMKEIEEGIAAAERGEGVPLKEVRAQWRKQHGKPT